MIFFRKFFVISFLLIGFFFLESSEIKFEDISQQHWLGGVVNVDYSYDDAAYYIQNSPDAVHNWASEVTDKFACQLVYGAKWGKIWSLGFYYSLNILYLRDKIIPLFGENDYVLIPFWGQVEGIAGKINSFLKNAKFPQNFFFLANSQHDADLLNREIGVQAFCVSHNAFINQNAFHPISCDKLYDAVYVGCCRPQKRLFLSEAILDSLLVVTHSDEENRKVIKDAKSIVCSPPMHKISDYINRAKCGIILSSGEGGCYGSTEYLLCGIPVVSTYSIGGRDAYYDEYNSIIVDDTPEAVLEGVKSLKLRNLDPQEIRNRALNVSNRMLDVLAHEILQPIFLKNNDRNMSSPRDFVKKIINKSSANFCSKGRTLFQPEFSILTFDEFLKIQQTVFNKG
jgi:glycosyltransferase involved in cell wall biosynthesis